VLPLALDFLSRSALRFSICRIWACLSNSAFTPGAAQGHIGVACHKEEGNHVGIAGEGHFHKTGRLEDNVSIAFLRIGDFFG